MPDTVHMENLLHTTCEDMIRKAENDYQYLKKHYDKVFVGGLSTGGHSIVPEEERHEAFRRAAMFLEALK